MLTERHDPTTSGFTPPGDGAARLSCNEVEALCLKAARGAGMAWGLAEEAGFAARWLHMRGLDGAAALLNHLDWADGRSWNDVRPVALADLRAAGGGLLCPVALGAAISDQSLPGRAGGDVETGPVHRPVLVLPFLHQVCSGRDLFVEAAGLRVRIGAGGGLTGDVARFAALGRATLRLAPAPQDESEAEITALPPQVPAAVMARLSAYAMRTVVPASAASRADAGSGMDDND